MNTSGIKPVNCNVLVMPDKVEDKIGGLYIPDDVKEKEQHRQTKGVIVGLCDDAFQEMTVRPRPGDRVYFARFEGSEVEGNDGEKYRLLKDIDITGVAV